MLERHVRLGYRLYDLHFSLVFLRSGVWDTWTRLIYRAGTTVLELHGLVTTVLFRCTLTISLQSR
jgi:hypothetical protein